MHGLLARTLHCFLQDTYGLGTWAEIARRADLDSPDFEAMLDSVATAASEMGGVQIIIGTTARPSVEAVVPIEHRLHAKGDDYVF